jgi:hypothetical protein
MFVSVAMSMFIVGEMTFVHWWKVTVRHFKSGFLAHGTPSFARRGITTLISWLRCSLKLKRDEPTHYAALQPIEGKPLERVGRKATGLRPAGVGYGSRVAGHPQHL